MIKNNVASQEEEVFVFPTSYAQQRLWFLDQLEPNSPFYNIPSAIRFKGVLNIQAFEYSIYAIIQRHETLRTTFALQEGEAVQVISPAASIAIPMIDLREIPHNLREAEAYRLARQEAARPFNLARGPLFRVTLLQLTENDYLVLLTMHHIISDGWSMGVIIREMSLHYESFRNGKTVPLPELEIQYGDFALWQREWLTGEVLEKQLEYWKTQLGDNDYVLELPTDRPRPAVQSARGATESTLFPPELLNSLKALSRQEDVTLFMTLLAAFKILLYRYTGQLKINVGTPIANRTRAEIEGLIGFFVNTLVLRTDLSADPCFKELLQRVKEITLGAYAHQDVPFEKLVEVLQPERDLSHTPLFQVMFSLQNTPMQVDVELSDVHLSTLDVDAGTSTFDLTLLLVEETNGLSATIEYNTDIFDVSTIRRLLKHYHCLLAAIVEQPDQAISQLPLTDPKEREQILIHWNQTAETYPLEKGIHHFFEAQVIRTPDAAAIVFQGNSITYRELNQRANQLAHYLRKSGIKPETVVGISTERSIEMVVGLFGILKAGGAYLPLDPNYPAERLTLMIEDANLSLILTQQKLGAQFADYQSKLIYLDSEWEKIAQEENSNLAEPFNSNNLAYVIYTSGSTGTPKGVQVSHRSVLNHNLSVIDLFRLTAHDRVLQFATINFDAAVEEIFPTLAVGATLVLRSNDILLAIDELMQMCQQEKLTVLDLPTAYWHEWVAELSRTQKTIPESLRLVILGGDKASPEWFRTWNQLGGIDLTLVNTYGPTEATVIATHYEPDFNDKQREDLFELPIGRPIANTRIYILDQNLEPTPVGVPGELYIGGEGLARGYLSRPELTAEKFVPDPFSTSGGKRLYRTGDLARYRSDGNIEFFGRVDYQVKVRGFRVETGEIESVLRQSPAVRDAAVIAVPTAPNSTEKQLIAYYVTDAENGLAMNALRDYLKTRLPDYMVPSFLMHLDKLPLTPTGKLDRRALPLPDKSRVESGQVYIAPRNAREEMLAKIWSVILGVERIGIKDNFFEIGGHSLLATQVISRIRENFEIELPLRSIFENPTVASLARVIESTQLAVSGRQVPPIEPIGRDRELPLSFTQQRLWFLYQLDPESPAYNIPSAVRIQGELNVAWLETSLNAVIERHEILRTNFKMIAGKPLQVIAPTLKLSLPLIDLTEQPESAQTATIREIASQEAQKPFLLDSEPLLRVTLLQLSSTEHVVLVTLQHIIADDWSTNVLIREIALLYDAFSRNEPAPLAELPLQYADYAYWQRHWLQGEVLENEIEYWKQQLAGSPNVLELPTDRPRPAVQTFNGAYETFELSSELTGTIHELSQQEGTTLFMTLLAAFQTLLYHYSGQEDISVGTPIANRTRSEIEGLIGCFVNTLVLRTDLSGEPDFKKLLTRVREVALGAYAHQDIPFEKLVEVLQPERELSHSPLFQVMFVLQNTPIQQFEISSGLTLSPLEADSRTAKFDLTLFMEETAGKLSGALEYNTDLFNDDTIKRMLVHFQNLLQALCDHPEQPLSELLMLTPAEREHLLVHYNDTQTDYPLDQFVPHLFEVQAEKTPDAAAVIYQEQQLSYLELNHKANQLGHYLQKLGIGPETLVGVCLERSPEMMIGLLAVLKAGGAYVPLDPGYPPDRLAYMLNDANVKVLLTQNRLKNDLPEINGRVICLDSEWDIIAEEATNNLLNELCPDNLAYIIYTSGSTGRPKGTQITHRGLINYLFWCIHHYPIKAGQGSLVHSSLAFDATITGLYAPLLVGRPVWLVPETKDLEILSTILKENQDFSLIKITPALMELLGHQLPAAAAQNCTRAFIIGGENLTTDHIAFWQANAPKTKLINEYGPTETVVGCMNYQAPANRRDRGSVPIGYPIANMQIYVLNPKLQPVPIGVPGEMYIGGVGVARGYLNRADLTADRFIPNPFSTTPGARLYKTGDLARYLADGNIEFLGRIDHQVKIRGFRIELGEIETVLGQYPALREVVVIAREDQPGNPLLVAYYTLSGEYKPTVTELRQFLVSELPEYMIPAVFVQLAALPLTPNGKVDRRALPVPEMERPDLAGTFVAPRTPEEELLAGRWQEVLGIEQIGIYDNFFELGGHSLIATQLISRIRETFNVELPVRVIFEAPTVATLAQRIKNFGKADRDEPPLVPISREQALVLSYAQQRLWFLDQLEPDSPFYNIPTAIRLNGHLNVTALEHSINALVQRHESLRTTFKKVEGQPYQVIQPEGQIPLEKVDLGNYAATDQEAQVRQLIRTDAQQPFDLSEGPLMRITLIHLAPAEHIILFNMHHIISDGWSIGVLIREVALFYEAFNNENTPELPELPIQYPDFAHWQRQWLQGQVLEQQIAYWKKQLSDFPPILELPTDNPRPAIQSFKGAHLSIDLPVELLVALEKLSRQEGVTLFMTLLAAFQTLLFRYSGQADINVGTPIANRNRAETEGLIGFFVNTLVLRTDLSGNPTVKELLQRVREVALSAYANQDVPFEMVVEKLQPVRDLSHTPLFQVMFVLQNIPLQSMEVSGLELVPLETESGTANFDLTLGMIANTDGLSATLEYNTDLFEQATIKRLLNHFQTLLEGIVTSPEKRISELPLLSAAEQRVILEDWNRTRIDYPAEKCIHELFEEQAKRIPRAIALNNLGQTLSYRELNQRANQLAHHLKKAGVGPEVLVGVCVRRSFEMVIGLLGIIKAGGAYVPMDPNYPRERLAYMIADSKVKILLTQEALLPNLPEKDGQVICLDRDWTQIADENQENLAVASHPLNLAYVIYTSGSTGRPKGVMLRHQGLCNLTAAQIKDFRVRSDSRVLQFASFSFDASVSEIFVALIAGATLYLVDQEMLLPGPALVKLLEEEKITVVTFPPSVLAVLPREKFTSLRTIVSAGESCSWDISKNWSKGHRFINAYGPTENTVCASSYHVEGEEQGVTTPIGIPTDNVQIYVLDQAMNLVPVGAAGELFIGGIGLARGYINRPDLTAEKFVPHPFCATPGERLYRTGDLVRYLPDGNLEFIGRIDHQVKVRGFRIELEEIERILNKQPLVRDVMVTVHEHSPGDLRIVAYVLGDKANPPTGTDLQHYLREQLPEYMLPSAFMILDEWPLTPNGKVDRKALPPPDYVAGKSQVEYVAPRDTLELKLTRIWQEVLGLERIGVNDNFFELGGHSLLAVRLMALIEEKFDRTIPLVSLFQEPTIEHLARELREEEGTSSFSPIVEFDKNETTEIPFYMVHPSGGSVHWYADLARHLALEVPLLGLQARGLIGKQELHATIEEMASYYVEAILNRQPNGPFFLGGWSLGVIIAYEMAQQLQGLGHEVAMLALFDQGPLIPKAAPRDDIEMLVEMFNRYFPLTADELRALAPEERLKLVLKKAKKAKVVPRFIRYKDFKHYIEVINIQTQAWRRYQPKIYSGAITLFRTQDYLKEGYKGPDLDWSEFVEGEIRILDVPGDHITMLDEPHVQTLADFIKAGVKSEYSRLSSGISE